MSETDIITALDNMGIAVCLTVKAVSKIRYDGKLASYQQAFVDQNSEKIYQYLVEKAAKWVIVKS